MPARLLQAVDIVQVVLAGSLIGRARMERHVEGWVLHDKILDLPPMQLTQRKQVGDVFGCFDSSNLQGVSA